MILCTSTIEKCNTDFIYLGKSVIMVNKPQSCPIWTITNPHTGFDVAISFQGIDSLPYNDKKKIKKFFDCFSM